MTILLENPIPIYFIGAVLLLITGLTFLARRTLRSLIWFVGAFVAIVLVLAVERLVVTEREELEVALATLLETLGRNDVPGVLAHVSPDALAVRADVEAMMPEAELNDTGATMVHIDLDPDGRPAATSQFLGKVDGRHKRSGHRVFYFDEVHINWVKRDGRWLVDSYQARWDGKPIDAVRSMRANRPKP